MQYANVRHVISCKTLIYVALRELVLDLSRFFRVQKLTTCRKRLQTGEDQVSGPQRGEFVVQKCPLRCVTV